MTAADDVRAKFEAGVSRYMGNGRASLARSEESGIYLVPAVESMWLGYRAAHADLSGELRELVEALDVARGKVNHVHLSLANNRVVGGSFSVDDETSCRWMGSLNIAGARLDDVRRALAKHTHQEKP